MIKIFLLLIMLIMMLTGCSKTVSYKYDETESQNGDWFVENGKISIREGGDLFKFIIEYQGETLISEGKTWNCKVMVCEKNKESFDEAEVLFSRMDIAGKEIAKGDIKVVDTDNDIIALENDYDLSTIYFLIEYTKENEVYEDSIKLSLNK